MSLIINKVSSCSTQINYSYLDSDFIFGYEVVGNYTVEFADITLTDNDGVLYSGIDALRIAYQQPNLTARIGSDEFLNGRLTSQSFEQSTLAGSSSCSITIEESKRLDNYAGNEFAENIPSPHLISSFQENFSFSRSGDSYSSTRNASITYRQDIGNQFLNNAKLFLSNVYRYLRPNGRFDENFRPLISETIDLLNLTVSIQETVQTSFIEDFFSKKVTYTEEIGEDGFTSKNYSVEIKALREPLEGKALDASKIVLDDILNENFADFKNPIEIGKGINRDGAIITLTILFSNDPKLNSDNTNSYNVTKSKNGNFYEYSITIEAQSTGKSKESKLANLKSFWQGLAGTYITKIESLFTSVGAIYLKSRDYSFSSKEPKITETVIYTQDDSYDSSGDILKDETSVSTKNALDRHRIFVSPETKGEVIEVASSLKAAGSETFSRNVITKMYVGIDGLIAILNTEENQDKISSDVITANIECVGSRVITYSTTQ
jgi:hypothetical protein